MPLTEANELTLKHLPTSDSIIRKAIKARLCRRHAKDDDAFVVEELPVGRGDSRVDVAVINGLIEGVEIKSSLDTLERLPRQVDRFGLAIEKMTLIVAPNHLEEASKIVPDWWTVLEVQRGPRDGISFKRVRRGKRNPGTSTEGYLKLLKRDELIGLLTLHDLDHGVRTATWRVIAERAAQMIPIEQLAIDVRQLLKDRILSEARLNQSAFGLSAAGGGLIHTHTRQLT